MYSFAAISYRLGCKQIQQLTHHVRVIELSAAHGAVGEGTVGADDEGGRQAFDTPLGEACAVLVEQQGECGGGLHLADEGEYRVYVLADVDRSPPG